MRFLYIILIFFFCSLSAQKNLPALHLHSHSDKSIYYQKNLKFDDNDLVISYILQDGWTNEIYCKHYIFKQNGRKAEKYVEVMNGNEKIEQIPLTDNETAILLEKVNSARFKNFLKYKQEDFLVHDKDKNILSCPWISDNPTTMLLVTHHGKQNFYKQYALNGTIETICEKPFYNITMLKEFKNLLDYLF